ncbi:MAG: hypothetical protein D6702_04620 [Planctomycetota bacterium]|nr:MAG: hypothetical protein D6702_04620 [Planctomycetota bacterium]
MKTHLRTLLAAALVGGALLSSPLAAAAPQDLPISISAEEAARKGPDGIPYGEDVLRALVYTAGAQQVNQIVTSALIESEIERRREAGMPVDHCVATPEEIDARIASLQEQFQKNNPQLDFWTTVEAMGNTRESYRKEIERMILIDKLFFPADPERWPLDLLREIFGPKERPGAPPQQGQEGEEQAPAMTPDIMTQTVMPTYEEAKRAKEAGEKFEVGGFVAQYVLRPGVLQWLRQNAEIVEPFDGLPAGVALRVNGRDFRTADLAAGIADLVGPVERERARMLVDTIWATEKALAEKGVLLTPEQCRQRIAEERKEYVNSPISYEQMQLQFLGYPSMEVFHRIYRLRQSFKDLMGEPAADELQAHIERRKSFLGQGKVDAEVIYFAARDMKTGLYPKEGDPFAEAEKRARQAAGELAAGADWAAVLLKYSDLPEAYPGTQPGMPTPNRGRFGALPRNQVRDFLGENDYFDFLYGVSVGDLIFFDAEPGTIYGPVMGPTGWCIYKVNRRLDPEVEIDIANNPRHDYLVRDDLLNVRFFAFVDEVMKALEG